MSQLPQRKSPRLKDYDYSQEGAYFVTVCVQDRLSLFGHVEGDTMTLNPAGESVAYWWQELSNRYEDIQLDLWVVMPNYFHGIVYINRHDTKHVITSLSDALQCFKTMTTNAYIRGVKTGNWKRFNRKLWQGRYHDHIIRNDADLNRIQEYVLTNSARWKTDIFYED